MISSGASGACTRSQHLEALVLQRLLDGAQPVRPLGVSGGREVVEAGGMGDEQSGHCRVVTRHRWRAQTFPLSAFSILSSPRRRGPIRRSLSMDCGVWVPGLARKCSLARDDNVYFSAAKLTPFGGGMESGTKKSTCKGWVGSTR